MDNPTRNAGESPNPEGELTLDQIIAEVSGDEIPAEVAAVDQGNTESQGKAAHAFKTLKDKAKAAAERAKKAEQELETLKKERTATPVTPTPGNQGDPRAKTVLAQLTVQAMTNLGLAQIVTPEDAEMVRMERQRIYNELSSASARSRQLQTEGPRLIERELENYQLDPKGQSEVTKRLVEMGLEQGTNPNVIRAEVARYLGERMLEGSQGEGFPDASSARSEGAAAAASEVRSGRRPGVKVPGARAQGPKPASPDELAEMRKLGLTDLTAFREAKGRVALYRQQ